MANVTVTDNSVLPISITVDGQPITISGARPAITIVRDTLTIEAGAAEVSSVNGQTGVVVLDTDDISEGTTNKYYSSTLFNTDFALKDTDDLTQGTTNLYYADSLVDAHLVGGTGVTYSAGNISIGQPVAITDDVEFNEVTAAEFIGNLRGANLMKAQAGEALTKGDVVYISGISGNTPVVNKADADDASKMPAVGLANATVSSSANVDVLTFGQITNIDTTQNIGGTWAEGDSLYVNTTAGQLTKTQPSGETSQVQKIAKIEKVQASTGILLIQGAGRSNATPNLDTGNIFIGDASGYSSTSSLDTEVSSLGYITASSTDTLTNKSGNISQWTNDAGYLTSETDSQTLSFANPDLSISNGNTVDLSALTTTSLPFASITSTPTTLAGYGITDGVTASSTTTFTNKSGSNSQWTNDAGYITASSTDTLTNKSGNISQWTNDSGYLTDITNESIGDLSDVDTTGITNGQYLIYNSTSSSFEPGSAPGGISAVEDDTSPTLGGTLDVNDFAITNTAVGSQFVDIASPLRITGGNNFRLNNAANTQAVTIAVDPNLSASYSFPLPQSNGTAGQFLRLDGTGTYLEYADVATELVEDTSPQLGGDLDTNGNVIFDSTGDTVTVEESKLVASPSGGDRNITLGDETFSGANFLLTNLKIDGQEERWPWITLDEFSDGAFPKSIAGGNFTNPLIISRIQGGTPSAPVGLLANKRIFGLQATVGYDDDGAGTNYVLPTSASFRFQAETTENQRTTARGSKVYFDTIANGSTSTTRTLEMQGSEAKFAGTINTTGASDLTIKANGGSNDVKVENLNLSSQSTGSPGNTTTPAGYIQIEINGSNVYMPYYV